jgi:hypothetical protein
MANEFGEEALATTRTSRGNEMENPHGRRMSLAHSGDSICMAQI